MGKSIVTQLAKMKAACAGIGTSCGAPCLGVEAPVLFLGRGSLCHGSFIYLRGCCVAPGALLHKRWRGAEDRGAVIVTGGCRITSLEQLVIRVAGM